MKRLAVLAVLFATSNPAAGQQCTGTLEPAAPVLRSSLFCGEPHDAICTENDIADYNHATGPRLDAFRKKAEKAIRSKGKKSAAKEFYAKLESDILNELGASREDLDRYFNGVRADLIRVIEERPLPRDTRNQMIASVAKARLVLPSEVINKDYEGVAHRCGSRGEKVNAYAAESEQMIVLCPSFLLVGHASSPQQNRSEQFPELYETIAHEFGHFLDSDNFRDEVKPLHDCLRDVIGVQSVVQDAGLGQIDDEEANEMIADHWAAEAVSYRLRGKDRYESFAFLRDVYHSYCSGDAKWKAGNPHIPDVGRIKFVLGQHPGVRDHMGCAAATRHQPTCNIDGVVTGRLSPRP